MNDKEKKIIEKLKNDFKLDKTDDDKIFRKTFRNFQEKIFQQRKMEKNKLIIRFDKI